MEAVFTASWSRGVWMITIVFVAVLLGAAAVCFVLAVRVPAQLLGAARARRGRGLREGDLRFES
jgi:hypothetical protein